MRAPTVFRGLLLLLAIIELLGFGEVLAQLSAYPALPLYLALAAAIVVSFSPLVGLWFYQRWARVLFIVILVLTVLDSVLHKSPLHVHLPYFFGAIRFLVSGLDGAIVAMMFLPPTRGLFDDGSNQSLEPTAGRRDDHI
jgi:hypothetical protein